MKLIRIQKQKTVGIKPSEYCKTLSEMSRYLGITIGQTRDLRTKVQLNFDPSIWGIMFHSGYSKSLFLEELERDIPLSKKAKIFIGD